MRNPVILLALALVLLGALPALAQQRPLFDPQTGAINPNGAWGNQPAQPGMPARPLVPMVGSSGLLPPPINGACRSPITSPTAAVRSTVAPRRTVPPALVDSIAPVTTSAVMLGRRPGRST
jgi:hypothetical protein